MSTMLGRDEQGVKKQINEAKKTELKVIGGVVSCFNKKMNPTEP